VLRFLLGDRVERGRLQRRGPRPRVSRVDVDWVLGPSVRWSLYAFALEFNRLLADEERDHVRTVVKAMPPGQCDPLGDPPPAATHARRGRRAALAVAASLATGSAVAHSVVG
jgi:hypothetical protein